MITELQAIYTNQKSFYGKARIKHLENGNKVLISYSTRVCELDDNNNIIYIAYYSQTTARHINDFIMQNGLAKMTKKEIEKLESEL